MQKINNEQINIQKNDDDEFIFKKLRIEINFVLKSNDIIYYLNTNARRFCISKLMKQKMFRLTHNENQHVEIHRNHERIFDTLYISRFFKKIKKYIEHCFNCQLIQIKRHKSYDELMSIILFSTLFHIIIMNFILALSNDLNIVFTMTNKYSKRVSLIVDKITYNASQ